MLMQWNGEMGVGNCQIKWHGKFDNRHYLRPLFTKLDRIVQQLLGLNQQLEIITLGGIGLPLFL
jgi:hypothetical protein